MFVTFRHGHMYVQHADGDGYTFPDPTSDEYEKAAHALRYGSPDRGQLLYIAGAADALAHLLTHPGGTEYAVGQLRELRRALKDKP